MPHHTHTPRYEVGVRTTKVPQPLILVPHQLPCPLSTLQKLTDDHWGLTLGSCSNTVHIICEHYKCAVTRAVNQLYGVFTT